MNYWEKRIKREIRDRIAPHLNRDLRNRQGTRREGTAEWYCHYLSSEDKELYIKWLQKRFGEEFEIWYGVPDWWEDATSGFCLRRKV